MLINLPNYKYKSVLLGVSSDFYDLRVIHYQMHLTLINRYFMCLRLLLHLCIPHH